MTTAKKILLWMICFPAAAQAATVIWGTGTIGRPYSGDPLQWSFGASDELRISCGNFFFEKSDYAYGVRITSSSFALAAYGSAFAVMSEGDVVDAVSMATGNLFSDPYGMVNGSGIYGRVISIARGSSIYLGFMTEVSVMDISLIDPNSPTDWMGYGWVKIGVDSNGQIVAEAAAIDLDGGPMIVGGGAFIPEPSSALLLLVGGALLVLRRRRRGDDW